METSENPTATRSDRNGSYKSNSAPFSKPRRFVAKFKAFVARIESVQVKIFLRRLGVAARSGWACLLVGLLLLYASPVNQWMAVPFFSLVICLNTIESSFGAVLRNVVGVLIGMAQATTIGVVVLSVLGTKLSLAPAIVCVFMGSFLVAQNTREMAKKVALSLVGIIFVTAHSGQNEKTLFFLVRLIGTTLIGASCAVVAVLVPLPGLACWEARESARSVVRESSELFENLVGAFCAKEASEFSSIVLHAKFLANVAWADITELCGRKVPSIWELRGSGLIPTFKRMLKGLSGIQFHLLGMTLALQSGTMLMTPGVMSAILKAPLQRIGEKTKSILELTTKLSKSKVVLREKHRLLADAEAEFTELEELIMVAREETYYKDKAEEQSLDELIARPNPQGFTANEKIKQLLRTMLPTYFFLFNLRMFFIETMNILNSGKIVKRMHQIPAASPQIFTLEQDKSPHSKPSESNEGNEPRTSNTKECGDINSGCEYQQPKSSPCKGCKKWLEGHGFRLDRAHFARAFNISLAMSIAALAGIRFNAQYAFWANVSIGFIVQQHQGGSFRMGSLRLQGTTIGAIYGYLAILITHKHPYMILISLIPWVTLLSYLRFSKIFGPSGIIAGLTAAIVMFGANIQPNQPIQDFALLRITENFIGVLSLVIVEAVVWPNRAVTLSRQNVVSSLTDLRDCVANVILAYTGHFCPEHRRMVVQGIKKLEQELRARFAEQADLQSEAAMEPNLWNFPFPVEIYSKLNFVQGRMLDLLYFMVCSLHAATEDCLNEQIEKLVVPLQTSLIALENEVLSSLDLLERMLQVKRHETVDLSEKFPSEDEENQLWKIAGTHLGDLHGMVGHVHPLSLLERRERDIDGTPLSIKLTVAAFEVRYEEVVCGFIAAKQENPARSLLSNSAMLSFSAVTFSLTSLLRETVELEKAVLELLHFEIPYSMLDVRETLPDIEENASRSVDEG